MVGEFIGRHKKSMTAAAAGLTLVLSGCSWNDWNPTNSITHDAVGGATGEIEANFPGATNIKVTHSGDNPNNMSWYYPGGKDGEDLYCTAIASATQNAGKTPGQIVTVPYCRPANPNEG